MADISLIRSGKPMTFGQQLKLTAQLSWPAMMAQLSSIMMQYIDAAIVERLGADDSAASAQRWAPSQPKSSRQAR